MVSQWICNRTKDYQLFLLALIGIEGLLLWMFHLLWKKRKGKWASRRKRVCGKQGWRQNQREVESRDSLYLVRKCGRGKQKPRWLSSEQKLPTFPQRTRIRRESPRELFFSFSHFVALLQDCSQTAKPSIKVRLVCERKNSIIRSSFQRAPFLNSSKVETYSGSRASRCPPGWTRGGRDSRRDTRAGIPRPTRWARRTAWTRSRYRRVKSCRRYPRESGKKEKEYFLGMLGKKFIENLLRSRRGWNLQKIGYMLALGYGELSVSNRETIRWGERRWWCKNTRGGTREYGKISLSFVVAFLLSLLQRFLTRTEPAKGFTLLMKCSNMVITATIAPHRLDGLTWPHAVNWESCQ